MRNQKSWLISMILGGLAAAPGFAQQPTGVPTAPDDEFRGVIGTTDRDSKPYYPPPVRPPKADSPNIVYIVLDDVGFADLGSFGSEIHTPNLDSLATGGLRYPNFHTRAICSPTRASLLTGRNSHAIGVRTVVNLENGYPNGRGRVTHAAATVAEILQQSGYATYAAGKWHLVPLNNSSPARPFDHWPLGRRFDHYYGSLDGMTDQYHPELVRDNTFIDTPAKPGYHLSADLVDQSIQFVSSHVASTPDRPFFLYLAFGAAHAPHQAPKAYLDKYEPVFAKGWDRTRDDRLKREKELGVVPSNTELSRRNPGIKLWDSLSADEKRFYLRLQTAFAGFLDYTDEQLGRLLAFLKQSGRFDNTVFVVISDNGASQEGGLEGTLDELASLSGVHSDLSKQLARIDDIGTERAFTNYPLGWAMAGNTPFPYYKQTVHGGGSNDPLIIHWPKGIKDPGAVRGQFLDVIDITPTILDITGIKAPTVYKGVPQIPLDGASALATIDDPNAPNPRETQYFEQGGNRAIWDHGWKAVALHVPGESFDQDKWELYNLNQDYSESNNLAAAYPRKLAELKDLWWSEARKHGVLPLDGRGLIGAALSRLKERTDLLNNREHYTFYQGQLHLPLGASPYAVNRSFRITASVDRPANGEGVLLAFGDPTDGFVLFVKDNKLVFEQNVLGEHTAITSDTAVPVGKSKLRYEFASKGLFEGTASLYIDDRQVASKELKYLKYPRLLYVAWRGIDIGRDETHGISPAYAGRGEFEFPAGGIERIDFDVDRRFGGQSTTTTAAAK